MKNALSMVMLGLAGYVAYQHYSLGIPWHLTLAGPILTPMGIQGMGCGPVPTGVGGIAPTSLYGGFAPNRGSSSLPTKSEISFNQRRAA